MSNQESVGPAVEMPQYQCHKKVRALQISGASQPNVLAPTTLFFQDQTYSPIVVPSEVLSRYWPKTGDYYVRYEDGYESISPQKAFEEGYTLVSKKLERDFNR